jgi:hypothetical protein
VRRIALALSLVAIAALGVLARTASAASDWYELGTGQNQFTPWGQFDLVDANHAPVIAWNADDPSHAGQQAIFTAVFNGQPLDAQPWVYVAGGTGAFSAVQAQEAQNPSVAMIQGFYYVAARVYDGTNYEVRVAKLVSGTWQEVGSGPSPINVSSTADASEVHIADVGGTPYVSWVEGLGTAHVKKWTGTQWSEVGTGPKPLQSGSDGPVDQAIVANIGGQPFVAMLMSSTADNPYEGSDHVYVKRFDGTSWDTVGGGAVSDTSLHADSVSIADVASGVPYVAYTEGINHAYHASSQPDVIRVKRLALGSWQTVGGPLNHDAFGGSTCSSQGGICYVHSASIAGNSSTPYVAWIEGGQVRVAKENDSQTGWDELGTQINRSASFNSATVVLRFVDGNPVVAWSEEVTHPDIDQTYGDLHTHVAAYGQAPQALSPPQMTRNAAPYGLGYSLHCTTGSWTADSSNYKTIWQRAPHGTPDSDTQSWGAIAGAEGPDYAPRAEDLGSRVRCLVLAAGSVFSGEAPSNSLQIDKGPPQTKGRPFVTGIPITTRDLTCNPGRWTNNPDFDYQWFRNGAPIPFRTSKVFHTQVPTENDALISCRVRAHNDFGERFRGSSAVHVVGRPPGFENRPILTISGDPAGNPAGRNAHCTPGTFSRDYGNYRWEWRRDGALIAGATGPDYTTTVDDIGHYLACYSYSTNPVGESGANRSFGQLIPLPLGVGKGTTFRTGGRNEFDPVNLMALSDAYKSKVDEIMTAKYQNAVDAKRNYCRNDFPQRNQIPDHTPVYTADEMIIGGPNFALIVCTILTRSPESDLSIGYYGVQYLGPTRKTRRNQPQRCDHVPTCPDLGFYVDPVTPGKEGSLDPATKMQLDPVTPDHVLWDFNGDGRVDADCPSGAPVVRTMLDKGFYHVHAIIIDKNSARTGVYWSATFDFGHPGPSSSFGDVRPGQVFACRTSIDPPPDPKLGSCMNAGQIGKVQVEGNFCPIYLRAIDPKFLASLPPDVYDVLKVMAARLPVLRQASVGPKPGTTRVSLDGNPLTEAGFLDSPYASGSGQFGHEATTAIAFKNTATALNQFDNVHKLLADELLDPTSVLNKKLGDAKWDPSRVDFAYDQIYLGNGPIKVDGTTLAPVDPNTSNPVPSTEYDKHPTLLTPSDAGDVAHDGEQAAQKITHTMILNNPDVSTALGDQGQIVLDPSTQLQQEIGDRKNQAVQEGTQVLRDQLNIDGYKQQLEQQAQQGIQEAKDRLKALDLGPLKISGADAKVELNPDNTVTLTATASIPFLQDPTSTPTDETQDSGDPTQQGSSDKPSQQSRNLRVTVKLKGDLTGKLTLQGVHLHAPSANLGAVLLQNVDFNYDQGVSVSGDILIPPGRQGVAIRDFNIGPDGSFRGLSVYYLAGAGTGIQIGTTPIYLTSLGGGFHYLPKTFNVDGQNITKHVASIDAGATFSVGPSPTGGGCATLGFDAAANIGIGGIPVFVADFTGHVQIVCIPIEKMTFHVDSTGLITLISQVDLHVGPIFVNGGLRAGIDLPNWQFGIDGNGGISGVPFLDNISMSAVISNIGLAGCGSIHGIPFVGTVAGGGAVRFNGGIPPVNLPQIIANIRLFTGCDLGDYKPVIKRAALRLASLNQSSFTMPKGGRGYLVSLEGVGRAPRVKLRSPSGKLYDLSNATRGVRFTNGIGQIVTSEDRSVALLIHPEAGTWTVSTAAGSPAVARIRIAPILPPPKVSGKVSGKGPKKTLTYNIAKQGGQVVRFVEGAPGSVKPIGTVKVGGKGKISYVTGEATGVRRVVIAQVQENGLPRDNLVIARYSAPNPTVGKPGRVRVVRQSAHAIVTWKRAALAVSYLVGVTDTHGGRYSFVPLPGQFKVTIPSVSRTEGLTVKVIGVSKANRHGPPGIAKLKAPTKKKHHKP